MTFRVGYPVRPEDLKDKRMVTAKVLRPNRPSCSAPTGWGRRLRQLVRLRRTPFCYWRCSIHAAAVVQSISHPGKTCTPGWHLKTRARAFARSTIGESHLMTDVAYVHRDAETVFLSPLLTRLTPIQIVKTVDPTVLRASRLRWASATSRSGRRAPMCGRTDPDSTIANRAAMPSADSSGVA